MRVKIGYTVELEEVPDRVTEFLKESVHGLATASSDLMDVSVVEHANIALDKIDNIRQKLALVDSRLEDCYIALAGYHNAKMEEYNPDHHHQPPHGAESVNPDDMAALMEEMNILKTSTNNLQQEVEGEGGKDE